jgi:hypothetical protein
MMPKPLMAEPNGDSEVLGGRPLQPDELALQGPAGVVTVTQAVWSHANQSTEATVRDESPSQSEHVPDRVTLVQAVPNAATTLPKHNFASVSIDHKAHKA